MNNMMVGSMIDDRVTRERCLVDILCTYRAMGCNDDAFLFT